MEQLKQRCAVRTIQLDLLKLASLNLAMKSDKRGGRSAKWALGQDLIAQQSRINLVERKHQRQNNARKVKAN